MKATTDFYNAIHRLYPFIAFLLSPGRKKLARLINRQPEGSLLEIGAGHGGLLQSLQRHRCTGIDLSEAMLRSARQRISREGVALRSMNGEQLLFPDDHFDYVVINHVLSVTEDPEKMLHEAYRVLRTGGVLFLHNHFTPTHCLRYLDQVLKPVGRWLHFRSVFRSQDISGLHLFKRRVVLSTMPFGYFRLFMLYK